MADKNIKKVILPQSKLLSANVEEGSSVAKYLVRYRVISEDKTRTSAWSPKYAVEARTVSSIINNATVPYKIFSNGDRLNLSWTTPKEITSPTFDVYVSWSNNGLDGSWQDGEIPEDAETPATNPPVTVSEQSFSVAVEPGKKYVKMWVQLTTFPKNRSNAAVLFETDPTPTAYKINGGTP
jgi:hypothetical protein